MGPDPHVAPADGKGEVDPGGHSCFPNLRNVIKMNEVELVRRSESRRRRETRRRRARSSELDT